MASNAVEGSVDNKIKVSMDNEIIARTAGDTNSLNSAKSYTDQQIAALDIDVTKEETQSVEEVKRQVLNALEPIEVTFSPIVTEVNA